jgi:hypothetical protein
MEYIVTSDSKVCGKTKGEKLTETDILSKGSTVKFLLETGHITESAKAPKAVKEVKEEEVQQVVETPPVFNLDNEQGENQPWQE